MSPDSVADARLIELWEHLASTSLPASRKSELQSIVQPEVRLHLPYRSAYLAGMATTALDREVRRAVRAVAETSDTRPSPLPRGRGELLVRDAREGSLELVFDAWGEVHRFLQSEPIALISTTWTLLGMAGFIRRRWPRSGDVEPTVLPAPVSVAELPPSVVETVDKVTEEAANLISQGTPAGAHFSFDRDGSWTASLVPAERRAQNASSRQDARGKTKKSGH